MSDKAVEFLSNLVVYNKYANFIPSMGRRQTWEECVLEGEEMHMRKYPELIPEITRAFSYVYEKKVMPSMRSIQYGGRPTEMNPVRIYNCSYAPIDNPFAFSELFFQLLSGTGTGYSVRRRHIRKLPPIVSPQGNRRFLIGDSVEGWADSIRQLIYAYMKGKEKPRFDYSDIRPVGAPIRSGGRSSGHKKLKIAHENISAVLSQAVGRRLFPLECHDIICYMADCVISGGKRDSAMISLFDLDETPMIRCKSDFNVEDYSIVGSYSDGDDHGKEVTLTISRHEGSIANQYGSGKVYRISEKYGDWDIKNLKDNGKVSWYTVHPQRARANNSIALRRGQVPKKKFMDVFEVTKEYGEPAFIWTDDDDSGVNPCLTGDTLVQTKEDGVVKISDIIGKKRSLLLNGEYNETTDCGFVSTGIKGVYKIQLANGMEVKATSNHMFLSKGKWVEVSSLSDGDRLDFSQNGTDHSWSGIGGTKDEGWLIGNLVGDGHFDADKSVYFDYWSDNKRDMHKICMESIKAVVRDAVENRVYSNKEMPKESYNKVSLHSVRFVDVAHKWGVTNDNKCIGDTIERGGSDFYKGVIGGIFDADGCVWGNSQIGMYVEISQSNLNTVKTLQRMMFRLGIPSSIYLTREAGQSLLPDGNGGKAMYDTVDNYQLRVSGRIMVKKFFDIIDTRDTTKRNKYLNEEGKYVKAPYNVVGSTSSPIVSIEFVGEEEVYDCTVPSVSSFEANGLISHNCAEIALNPNQFCNLTSVVAFDVDTQEELNNRVRAAAFIGTLQAGYTDFHYIRHIWKETTEREALLGISMTGIASGTVLSLDLKEAARVGVEENVRVSKIIGINPAARITTLKPEGTGTLACKVVGSGIHAAHSDQFIRNVRINKADPLYAYLLEHMPNFVETDVMNDTKAVVSVPIKAPAGIITRDEPIQQFLDRVIRFSLDWVKEGHVSGVNKHNVSATISVKPDEWEFVSEWMWKNRNIYSGLSLMPYSGGNYKQAPFIEISEEQYNKMMETFPTDIDLTQIQETESLVNHAGSNLACPGGACEIQ